ncbi:WhiB family transcriptional regulator [Nocardia sp. NPDC005746]|uniref:WhiB family transcriptional regulator n=1 Tax=Nocardia sp. NPDC005746 TaxID=3157062 RepID=UPI0033D8CEE8
MPNLQDDAACKGREGLFFPVGRIDNDARRELAADAVAICGACPVRAQCAAQALKSDIRHGVIAGVDMGDSTSSNVTRRLARARAQLEAVARGQAA